MKQKRVRRLIEYEGSVADVEKALSLALLSVQREVEPGDVLPGIGAIAAHPGAPQVTIRLIAETEMTLGQGLIWKERRRAASGNA